MPGSVANAAPSTVLPYSLCSSFMRSHTYAVEENEYRGGESQRRAMTATSRKRWVLSMRLTPAQADDFYQFLIDLNWIEPFWFYDLQESGNTYDATGVQTLGRYTVCSVAPWKQQRDLARIGAGLQLEELA